MYKVKGTSCLERAFYIELKTSYFQLTQPS